MHLGCSHANAYITHFHVVIELLLLIPKEKVDNLAFIHELGLSYLFATQWAAVITHCAEMMVPPQMCFCLRFRDTWITKSLSGSKSMPCDPSHKTWRLSIFWKIGPDVLYTNIRSCGVWRSKICPITAQKGSVGTRILPTLVYRRGS